MTIDDYDSLFMRVLKSDGQTAAIRAVVDSAQGDAMARIAALEEKVRRLVEDAAGSSL